MPKNPHANFSPVLDGYSGQEPFRFWCQMALPLTFDDSLSYYELLNKVVAYVNNTINDVATAEENIDKLSKAYDELQQYVNDYFDDIDVEAELRNVLDAMAEDGSFDQLLDPIVAYRLPLVVGDQLGSVVADQIGGAVADQLDDVVEEQLPAVAAESVPSVVTDWLDDNVTPVGSAVVVDSSLSVSGAAADAKVTGDEIRQLKTNMVYHESTNHFDANAKTTGQLNVTDGSIDTSITTASVTDWISVEDGTVVRIGYVNNSNVVTAFTTRYATYDEEKHFIRGVQNVYNITVGENEKYVRVGIVNSYLQYPVAITFNTLMADYTYEPYYTPYWSYTEDFLTDETKQLITDLNETTQSNTAFIDEISNKIVYHESTNHFDANAKTTGQLDVTDGSIDTSITTASVSDWISVEDGTVVRIGYVNNSNAVTAFTTRFATYDEEKHFIRGVQSSYNITVGENEKYIRVGIENSYLAYPVAIVFNTQISEYTYEPYYTPYNAYTEDFLTAETKRQLENLATIFDIPYNNNKSTLSGSDILRVAAPHAKRNYTISFRGKITTFGKIIIGIGKDASYLSGWIEVDDTNIKVYTKKGSVAVLAGTYAHGLTFSETINVNIRATSITSCEVILSTVGGTFKTESNWFGCYGFSFANFEGRVTAETDGGVFTECHLAYYCADYMKQIWGFGDSYFDHWPKIAIENGYSNFAIDGASGRHSIEAWHSFELESEKRLPKKILWCMGMNDADSLSAVNSSWKTCYDRLTAFCNVHDIELILCTIPCVPERNNSFKNQIIRESGYRYVDIADAVGGSETGSTWYDGLLEPNADPTLRVHPTTAGDKVIAARFMADVPELMDS